MTQVPKHTGVAGPELVRLLARLAQVGGQAKVATSDATFDLQLSQWLGWTDAVALAAGLDVAAAARPPLGVATSVEVWLLEATRVRSGLARAISRHGASPAKMPRVLVDVRASLTSDVRASGNGMNGDAADFSVQRQHIRQHQGSMESAVSGLRASLRAALSSSSVATAKLAAVDSVIEHALAAPMHSLTSAVPRLLERYFRQLQPSPPPGPASSEARPVWLNSYLKEQEKVLLAELDFRFQPIEGLMAALQSASHGAPAAAFEPT